MDDESINNNNVNHEIVYQVDSATYSGGSGCPFVDNDGNIIGILFQNLKFETSKSYIQVPNSGFIISKYIILQILDLIENCKENEIPDFSQIKLFNINDFKINPIFNFIGLKPKF